MVRLLVVAWLAAVAVRPAAAKAAPARLSWDALARDNEPMRDLARLAREHGVTFGIWGGTVRDLYLRHPFTVISDFDVIVDSSEAGYPAFRDALLEYNHRHAATMPKVDFHYDLAQETERQLYYHGTGITATKVGLFPDGRVLDPTGHGVRDLEEGVFRFHARGDSAKASIALQDVGRFTRDLARLIDMRKDPATIAKLRGTLEHILEDRRAAGRDLDRAARVLRRVAAEDGLLTFRLLMPIARRDHLHLHHDRHAELGPTFPLGMFVLELFKTVTQAPTEAAHREAFRLAGADRFLRRLGFTREAALLMDPRLGRAELFETFVFPGSARSKELRLTRGEARRRALLWVRYAGAFRHLVRRLPPGSFARRHVERKVTPLLKPSSFSTFSPGEDVAFEAATFLDTDFSTGVLDEAWTRRTLAAWVKARPARARDPREALAEAGIDDEAGRQGLQEMLDFLQDRREAAAR